MSDIDILVQKGKDSEVKEIVESLGYENTLFHRDNLSVYEKMPYVSAELHVRLLSAPVEQKEYFDSIWERLVEDEIQKNHFHMTQEDFLIYVLAHHAKHYYGGGCGVRPVLDLYLYNRKYSEAWNEKYVEAVLEELHLSGFRREMTELAEVWFSTGNVACNESQVKMAEYIYESGSYGTMENAVKNALEAQVQGRKKKSKLQYCIGRLYKPYDIMCIRYPYLEKYALLYPICWIHLFAKAVLGKEGRVRREMKVVWGRK